MLIDDMRPDYDGTMVEFKPKWLAQSPSAPPGSIRCRNCARRAERAQKNLAKAEDETTSAPSFCPLSFFKACLSSNARDVKIAAGKILREQGFIKETTTDDDSSVKPQLSTENKDLIKWLTIAFMDNRFSQEILHRLEADQRLLDRHGGILNVFSPADSSNRIRIPGFTSKETAEEMCKAMTIRDCTLFVRISHNPNDRSRKRFSARLGDLDVKSPDKGQYWHDTEKALNDDRWYQGRIVKGLRAEGSIHSEPRLREGIIRDRIVCKLSDIFGAVDHFSTISEPIVAILLAGFRGHVNQISSLGNGYIWDEVLPQSNEKSITDTLKLLRLHSEVLDCHLNPEWLSLMERFKIGSFRDADGVVTMEASHNSMDFAMRDSMEELLEDVVEEKLDYSY